MKYIFRDDLPEHIFRDDLPEHLRDIFPPLRELSSPVARMSIQAR